MILIGDETPFDIAGREALLDLAMGVDRKLKSSERLREGQDPAEGLALIARDVAADGPARIAGTVRLWHVQAGDTSALLLGPLAVAPERQSDGVGGKLMREAIARAKAAGHGAILLVGDPEYYVRFGFSVAQTGGLAMPGAYEQRRLLGLELIAGALDGATGMIGAPFTVADDVAAESAFEAAAARAESGSLRWSAGLIPHAA